MDEAAILNSMTVDELVGICSRLQRSCNDMSMLLSEFQQEQDMLYREQDRLHHRIEKAAMKAERATATQDGGLIWGLYAEVEQFFKEKEERKAAKRRRRASPAGPGGFAPALGGAAFPSAPSAEEDEEDCGPFSDASVQMSWGCDVSLGALRQSRGEDITTLHTWVREALCGESVAEFELPSDQRAAQMAAAAAAVQVGPTSFGPSEAQLLAEPATGHRGTPSSMGGPPPSARDMSRGERGGLATAEPSPLESLVSTALGLAGERSTVAGPVAASVASRDGGGTASASLPLRRTAEGVLATGLGLLADLAGGGNQVSPGEPANWPTDADVVSLTVVLRRSHESQRWGLGWIHQGFVEKKERIVKELKAGSVAASWNDQQEAAGFPERCIRPMDRLVSVNGRTGRDEMTTELAGREAVLEFHRATARNASAPRTQADANASGEQGPAAAHPAASRKATKRETFAESLPAYLQTLRHVSASPAATDVPAESEEAMSDDEGVVHDLGRPGDLAASPSLSAAETAMSDGPTGGEPITASEWDKQLRALRAPRNSEPSHVPHRVVAQVLSLTAGSVRLSWLFDWAVAPSDLVGAVGVVQGYRIRQRREAGAHGDSQVELIHCERAALNLQLPVGHRYSFEVQALLVDSSGTIDPSSDPSLHEVPPSLASILGGAGPEAALWTSASSSAVVADLRGSLGAAQRSPPAAASGGLPGPAAPVATAATVALSPRSREVPAPGVNGAAPASVSGPAGATERPRRATVAASLGSFLAMQPRPGGTTAGGASPSTPPSRAPVSFAPPPRSAAPAVLETVGTGDGDKLPQQVAAVADPQPSPLASAQPRVVSAGPLDPASEKREVAGRLLLRRGQPLLPREEATLQDKLRKLTADSDDDEESLMKLSSALSTLERTAATRRQSAVKGTDHVVAEEGHHGLQERLEPPPPPWKVPGHRAGGVVAATVCHPKDLNPLEGDALVGDDEVPRERSLRLTVHTDGKTPVLEFNPGDDLVSLVPVFMKDHGIREALKEPLLSRARILLNSGRQEDGVDIIDLL